jgi:hypothetical protein
MWKTKIEFDYNNTIPTSWKSNSCAT